MLLLLFDSGSLWQTLIHGICKDFLIKKCFSVYITHSSVNFTLFALLRQQKVNDRPLFMH